MDSYFRAARGVTGLSHTPTTSGGGGGEGGGGVELERVVGELEREVGLKGGVVGSFGYNNGTWSQWKYEWWAKLGLSWG